MRIPEPNNVSQVLVDGEMWSHEVRDDRPGWSARGDWLDVPAFEVYLDDAHMVTFYSPTGRVIDA